MAAMRLASPKCDVAAELSSISAESSIAWAPDFHFRETVSDRGTTSEILGRSSPGLCAVLPSAGRRSVAAAEQPACSAGELPTDAEMIAHFQSHRREFDDRRTAEQSGQSPAITWPAMGRSGYLNPTQRKRRKRPDRSIASWHLPPTAFSWPPTTA